MASLTWGSVVEATAAARRFLPLPLQITRQTGRVLERMNGPGVRSLVRSSCPIATFLRIGRGHTLFMNPFGQIGVAATRAAKSRRRRDVVRLRDYTLGAPGTDLAALRSCGMHR